MSVVKMCGDNHLYRNLYLKIDGREEALQDIDTDECDGLTPAQRTVIDKIAYGDADIIIAEDGSISLQME
ncbi:MULTISPECIES: hypothetical protein [unclassified Bradyrhizobium]|uniref:hypothetical protein n=1 Tax=unclassified Bradyrhizobium TaxID=2631580 RepID=UPI002916EF6C|nr:MULTISPECIES: hypothetical protein [unclassified Bradyrhizobium]